MCEGFSTTQRQICSPGRAGTLTQFPAYLGCSSLTESFPRGGWGDIPSARLATQNSIVYPVGFHIAPHIRSLLLVHVKATFFSLRGLFSMVLGSQASKHHRDSNCGCDFSCAVTIDPYPVFCLPKHASPFVRLIIHPPSCRVQYQTAPTPVPVWVRIYCLMNRLWKPIRTVS